MSKSSKRWAYGIAGVALGYFLAKKLGDENEKNIKDYLFKKGKGVVDEAKNFMNNEDSLTSFMKKIDIVSEELDEKISLLKKILEDKK